MTSPRLAVVRSVHRHVRRALPLIALSVASCTAASAQADPSRAGERAVTRARVLDDAARDERDEARRRAIVQAADDERACAVALDRERGLEPDPGGAPRKVEKPVWYGWQVLVADGASLAALGANPLLAIGGYALAAPIVHAAHRRWDSAAASLGTRLLLPPALAFVGASVDRAGSGGGDFDGLGGAVLGGALGIAGAVILDAAVYARTTKMVDEPERRSRPVLTGALAPRREGGVDVGVGVAF